MRFSTMTSFSNAPSRLTFPLPSTPFQTQRTGKIFDSNFTGVNYPQQILEDQFPRLLQSESDQIRIREIAEQVAPYCKRYLKIYYYNHNDPAKQPLESYQKWLDNLKEILQENGLQFSTEMRPGNSNKKDYILGINFYHYSARKLKTLKSLLTKKLP